MTSPREILGGHSNQASLRARDTVWLDTWRGIWFMPVMKGLIWLGIDRLFFRKERT